MAELIYKQQALDAINRCRDDYDLARQEQIDDCENAVRELTAVTERTGYWNKISPAGIYECSECGKTVMTSDIDAYDFCHGCGAHMIEKGE